jgi:hypothetical protein
MFPNDERDIKACYPALKKEIERAEQYEPPTPPLPAFGRHGKVYILTHPLHSEWVKIGYTTADARSRAEDYSSVHKFDGEWELAWSVDTPEAKTVEERVHGQLMKHRVTCGSATEVFSVSVRDPIHLIEREVEKYRSPQKYFASQAAADPGVV